MLVLLQENWLGSGSNVLVNFFPETGNGFFFLFFLEGGGVVVSVVQPLL